ncbi:MAG: hypothetical protein E7Z65_03835 [Thermoplasmata archaeon]|nr:hypothetical protein [Thermoplasmata archaeon]
MTSDFECEYKMNSPLTGCKAIVKVRRKGTDAPVMTFDLSENTSGYLKQGEMEISKDIVKEVRGLVDRNLVAIRNNLVPGIVTDTSDKTFKVTIDGRAHSFKSENIEKMTKDNAVEEAWGILVKYIPDEVKQGSKLIFG